MPHRSIMKTGMIDHTVRLYLQIFVEIKSFYPDFVALHLRCWLNFFNHQEHC
jgi:hypothetical protein